MSHILTHTFYTSYYSCTTSRSYGAAGFKKIQSDYQNYNYSFALNELQLSQNIIQIIIIYNKIFAYGVWDSAMQLITRTPAESRSATIGGGVYTIAAAAWGASNAESSLDPSHDRYMSLVSSTLQQRSGQWAFDR